jgi:glycosyltransferase involved in cell wall biosynthesis
MRILIVENGFNDLKKSRLPLGLFFQFAGNEVLYACPDPLEEGICSIPMSRNSLAPIRLMNGHLRLVSVEISNSIDAVLSFRFIPNVLNYLASFCNGEAKRVAVITGLGYAFIKDNNSISSIIQRTLIKSFYRMAEKRIQIIAQNPDDLVDLGVKKGEVILGSGVKGKGSPLQGTNEQNYINLLYVGRLLKSKGVLYAIEIFEELRKRRDHVSLTLAGTIDEENPDSITETELLQLKNKDGVSYLGFVSNMDPVYKQCNVLLFPSIYREGVPRVIIESLMYGLTIVTRDMPGCKETVRDNGYLINENCTSSQVADYLANLDLSTMLENQKRSVDLFNNTFSADVIYPQYLDKLN